MRGEWRRGARGECHVQALRVSGARVEGARARAEAGEHAPRDALCCLERALDAHAERKAARAKREVCRYRLRLREAEDPGTSHRPAAGTRRRVK